MKALNLTVLFFTLLLSTLSFAQSQFESSWQLKKLIRDKLNTQEKANPIKLSEIKGSPYISDEFKDGEYYLNEESQGHFYLRYNVHKDQIEILEDISPENLSLDEPTINTFLKYNKSKVVIDGKTIRSYYYNDDNNKMVNSYFIEVNKTDKLTLLLRKRCVLTPAEKAISPNHPDRAARFTTYDDYYIISEDEKYPKKIELKKHKLLKEFPEQANALKLFIKKENINLYEESDLVKLINYMSTL